MATNAFLLFPCGFLMAREHSRRLKRGKIGSAALEAATGVFVVLLSQAHSDARGSESGCGGQLGG